jgi:hypothetical protein
MKPKHMMYAIGGLLAFSFFKGRGFTLGRTPNFSRMSEGQIIAYLRRAYQFDDTKVNEFMSGFREAKALREMNAPDFNAMSINELLHYINDTFHIQGAQATSLVRSMDSYLKAKMSPDFYRLREPELRAFLRRTYQVNDLEVSLLFRVYQELIFKQRLAQPPAHAPKGWLQKVTDFVVPPWLTWELFSWKTLAAIPGALAKIPKMEFDRLMTPSGIGGLALALLIGPEILAYWGFVGAEAAAFGAVDYWIAASNSKDIIDGVLRSGGKGGVAVMTGSVASSFLSGGTKGTFLRQLAGNMAGDNLGFQLEKATKSS